MADQRGGAVQCHPRLGVARRFAFSILLLPTILEMGKLRPRDGSCLEAKSPDFSKLNPAVGYRCPTTSLEQPPPPGSGRDDCRIP